MAINKKKKEFWVIMFLLLSHQQLLATECFKMLQQFQPLTLDLELGNKALMSLEVQPTVLKVVFRTRSQAVIASRAILSWRKVGGIISQGGNF